MRAFWIIVFFITSQTGLAQKGGYEVIQIGKNFYDKTIADDYSMDFSSTDSTVFRLRGKLPKFICEEAVEYFDVEIGTDSVIKRVSLYTMGKLYPDNNAFVNNFQNISRCIVGALGRPEYLNNKKNLKEGTMTAGWKFPELKTLFIVYTYDLPVQINNVKKMFKMVWRVYDPNEPKTTW